MATESEMSAFSKIRKAAAGREWCPEGLPPKPQNHAETKGGAPNTLRTRRSEPWPLH